MSESQVVSACLAYLHRNKIFAWRNNTGAFKTNHGFIRFGLAGSADIIGLTKSGQFLAIECKFGKGKQEPSQIAFEQKITDNGGLYLLVYSLDELKIKLQQLDK